jgi:hypothetical protein
VTAVRVGTSRAVRLSRRVVLSVPLDAVLSSASGKKARWADLDAGTKVTATTLPVEPTLAAQRARPGALALAGLLVR